VCGPPVQEGWSGVRWGGRAVRGPAAGPDPAGQAQAGREPTQGQGPGTLGRPAGLAVSHC